MLILKQLNSTEKRAFKLHLFYSSIDGIARGALILNQFIFIKSLKGSNVQLAFLFQFSMVVFLFAMLTNEIMRRYPNRKVLLRTVGIITQLPLVAFAAFPVVTYSGLPPRFHYMFLGVFLLFYTSRIAVIPSINQYLKGNYRHKNFGTLFSYATTINKVLIMVSTLVVGLLLDYDPNSYRIFYPMVGILGIISIFQLTKIDFKQDMDPGNQPLSQALGHSFKRVFLILRNNTPFRHLELGFMLYGFAWMSTYAVITIFYKEVLDLNYSSVSLYNNAYNLVAIALLPLFGKLISNNDPRRFGIITFGALMLFIAFTGLSEHYGNYHEVWGLKLYYMLMIGVLFNGIFMGSMPILWGIGSSYFCEPNEAADYQSVHLFLTGVRALFAPIIGIKLYEMFGFGITYGVSMGLLALAIALMIYSERRYPIKTD
ncbi:Major Facilitator Superfamily protein [Saccharicrinis carchari]|uniref:Major Facilitator Superfamily protein n=1 Tax=Saccharicrinis carchari TaxID=1168039 RepID=A0A521AMU7_SACCC|nr:MFS transporter [Saccharicrinis carchari]SMO36139.1 Major Facilitator Superfamily protein [Saccharicrinis carchari]